MYSLDLWASLSCAWAFSVPVVVAPTVSASVGSLSAPVVCAELTQAVHVVVVWRNPPTRRYA